MLRQDSESTGGAARSHTPLLRRMSRTIDSWLTGRRSDQHEPLDTMIRVVSPENIAFNYRVAGPFRRLLAFLLDLVFVLIFFAALYIIVYLLILLVGMASFALGLGRIAMSFWMFSDGVLSVLVFFFWWFYGAFFETWMNGQTLGKRVFGLRVLSTDGSPINGLQATLRTIVRAAEALPFVTIQILDPWIQPWFAETPGALSQVPWVPFYPTFLVGLVAMSLSPRFQRIGDMVCGTMVVYEERSWAHGLTALDDPRAPQLAAYFPPGFVINQSLARTVAAYVDRRRNFSAPRRREIAKHLAVPLIERFNFPADTSYDLLLCALYYRAFIAEQAAEDATDFRLNEQARRFEATMPGAALNRPAHPYHPTQSQGMGQI